MENNKNFSIKRLLWMIRKDLFDNLKFVLIGYGSIIGLFLFIFFITAYNHNIETTDLIKFYGIGLFLSGIFISGMAFSDFRSKEKTISYLTLPASLLEKFLSMLLLSTIGFIISFTVIFFIFNGLAIAAGLAFFDLDVGFVNLFTEDTGDVILAYIIAQSLFLVGAATFRKVPLFFTLFSLFLVGVVTATYFGILTYSLFNEFKGSSSSGNMSFKFEDDTIMKYFKYLMYYATAPVFWVVTYFKLKEKEV